MDDGILNLPIVLKSMGLLLATTALASVSIGPLQRALLTPKKQNNISRVVPFVAIQDALQISQRAASCVIRYEGHAYESQSEREIEEAANAMNRFIQAASERQLTLRFISVNRKAWKAERVETGNWFVDPLENSLRENLENVCVSQYYVVISDEPNSTNSVKKVNEAADLALRSLERFKPVLLDNSKGDAMEFWGQIAAPITCPKPAGNGDNVISALCTDDITIDKHENIEFSSGDNILPMRAYHALKLGREFDNRFAWDLMKGVHGITVQYVKPLSTNQGKTHLHTKQTGEFIAERFNKNLSTRYENAKTEITDQSQGQKSWCEYGYGIFAFADDKTVEELDKQILSSGQEYGYTIRRANALTLELYRSLWPGYKWPIKDHAVSSAIALHLTQGRETGAVYKSPWLDKPLTYFKTANDNLFPWHFHASETVDPLGNGLVFGTSGSGKSTMIARLIGLLRQNRNMIALCFDYDRGLLLPTLASGGRYIGDEEVGSYSFNPCQMHSESAEDREEARAFLTTFLRILIDDDDDETNLQIDRAVRICFDKRLGTRKLSYLRDVAFPKGSTAHRKLEKWTDEGSAMGRLFNTSQDSMAFDKHQWFTFSMNRFQSDHQLAAAFTALIIHRVYQLANETGKGLMVFVDEAATVLREPNMRQHANRLYERLRKKNGAIWTAWQYPKQMIDNNCQGLAENAGTTLFLPPRAPEYDQYQPLGVSQEQFELIKGNHPMLNGIERYAIVRRGESLVVLNNDMSAGGKLLRIFGGKDSVDLYEKYLSEGCSQDDALRKVAGL